jgi:hypothetical protein
MVATLKKIYYSNPLLVLIAVVLIIFIIVIYIMRKQALKQAVTRLQSTNPDDMKLSYLGRADLPRGVRNNNPGNLQQTTIPWQGKIPNPTDSRFEQFREYVWGVRAKIRDITGDISRKGQNTIRKLITAYAPAFENNTASYITNLSNRMGMSPDALLDANNHAQMMRLCQHIAIIENGAPLPKIGQSQWISDSMFNAAWQLHKA